MKIETPIEFVQRLDVPWPTSSQDEWLADAIEKREREAIERVFTQALDKMQDGNMGHYEVAMELRDTLNRVLVSLGLPEE